MAAINSAVISFAGRMQYKLDLNKDKDCDIMNPDGDGRGWKHCSIDWLFERLLEEAEELRQAIALNTPGRYDKILNESADVGNFAMMIFDIVRASMEHFNEPTDPEKP